VNNRSSWDVPNIHHPSAADRATRLIAHAGTFFAGFITALIAVAWLALGGN